MKSVAGFVLPFCVSALFLSSCTSYQTVSEQAVSEVSFAKQDLAIVDCLLPSPIQRLGQMTYLAPRKPILTTAVDCRTRGGEYTEYDRADLKSALQVWLPTAEAGDAEAQTIVGEIFERGLGGEPNYALAKSWYEKAVQQNYSRAQFNLGTLYELGLGIEKDRLRALNYYRLASGLTEDSVIYQSAAQEEQLALKTELQQMIDDKSVQIKLLQNQIKTLQKNNSSSSEVNQLKQLVAELQETIDENVQQIIELPEFREPDSQFLSGSNSHTQKTDITLGNINFGKYYALIIGNQNYDYINDLKTPFSDAVQLKDLLENEYGFDVTLMLDANNIRMMQAFNNLNDTLTENDNLLIFYAGHGSRLKISDDAEIGYWLPTNANPPPNDTFWVSNEFVTRHLARLKAKRVLVVSDSCYAGLLSTTPSFVFTKDKPNYTDEFLKYKLPKKSRLLLSSGGDLPVLDNAGSGNSVFAKAFLETLRNSGPIISGPELFLQLKDSVKDNSKAVNFEQNPQLTAIKGAGHEVGDFFFVRKNSKSVAYSEQH